MSGRSPLGRPAQIAYAVDDVRAAARRRAATTGAGPFVVVEHIPLARVEGPAEFDHSSAYGWWGDVMVELVQEHTPPLVAAPGVHHLAFMVERLPDAMAWCADRGWREVLLAETATGQTFAFIDARADLGHLVELYEPTDRLTSFYAMVADLARGWDGRDPVHTPG